MDIWFINSNDRVHVRAASVHGMLWLQTHFEDEHWSSLAASEVRIPLEDAQELSKDAQQAGLMLNFFPALTVPGRF